MNPLDKEISFGSSPVNVKRWKDSMSPLTPSATCSTSPLATWANAKMFDRNGISWRHCSNAHVRDEGIVEGTQQHGEEMFQINIHLHDRWLLDQKTDESAMSPIKNQLHLPQTNVSSLSDSNANHVHGGEIGCSDAVSSNWIAKHLRLTRCCTAHLSSWNIHFDDVSQMRLCPSASRG